MHAVPPGKRGGEVRGFEEAVQLAGGARGEGGEGAGREALEVVRGEEAEDGVAGPPAGLGQDEGGGDEPGRAREGDRARRLAPRRRR
ncbi:hypothetical protein [uncultured Enterovirga sp.]|uniref:hypothetical protein n=1 Tax=uncultured Enterovirga sp. TaxID=2026352 RepID=UPI0035C9AAFE